jgi:uncharacterized protein (TIGR02246 family)
MQSERIMKRWSCFLLLTAITFGFCTLPTAHGQAELQPAKEDPAHEELRGLMKEILAASNADNVDKMLAVFEADAVVTWQNGEVTKGPKEIKAFFERMNKGHNRVVEKSTIKPVPDELAVLYNDGKTAVAWGKSQDHYVLTDGTEFDQDTRWSATLVKKNGKWKVASVHISVNLFSNPILNLAVKKTATWMGAGGAGIGALVGLVAGWVLFRGRSKPAPV